MVIPFGTKNFNKKISITLMFALPVMLGTSPGAEARCTSYERAEMVKAGLTGAEVRDVCDQAGREVDGVAEENAIVNEEISPVNENRRPPNESPQNKTIKEGGFGDVVGHASFQITRKNFENTDVSFTGLGFKGLTTSFSGMGDNAKLGAYFDLLIDFSNESESDTDIVDFSLGGGVAYKLQPDLITYVGLSLDARQIDGPAFVEGLQDGGVGYKAGFLSKLSDRFTLFGDYHVVSLDDEVAGDFDRYGVGLLWSGGDAGNNKSGRGITIFIKYEVESYDFSDATNIRVGIGSKI